MAFIKFLGTAGARFVMIEQLRSSGGLWVSYKDTNILIDPGPGSIVRCAVSRPKLNPLKLNGIILTHKHLDHSNDINVMIEAMTEGGFKKKGTVLIEEQGGTVTDSVGKSTDWLVAGPGSGSKSEKAGKLNVSIIDEKKLATMLK